MPQNLRLKKCSNAHSTENVIQIDVVSIGITYSEIVITITRFCECTRTRKVGRNTNKGYDTLSRITTFASSYSYNHITRKCFVAFNTCRSATVRRRGYGYVIGYSATLPVSPSYRPINLFISCSCR